MTNSTTAPPTTENVGALAAELRARHAEPDDLDSRLVVVAIEGRTLAEILAGRVEIVGLCCGPVNGPEQPWPALLNNCPLEWFCSSKPGIIHQADGARIDQSSPTCNLRRRLLCLLRSAT
jgi:hypothetical protein